MGMKKKKEEEFFKIKYIQTNETLIGDVEININFNLKQFDLSFQIFLLIFSKLIKFLQKYYLKNKM